jgi:hypothetical protein
LCDISVSSGVTGNGSFQMKISESDFSYLATTSMAWATTEWREQIRRFDVEGDDELRFDWKAVYWYDQIGNLILAKTFLDSLQEEYQWGYDSGSNEWFIVTNYEADYMKETK